MTSRLDRIYAWLRRVLSHPRADLWILVVATALAAPSIGSGLAADDFVHDLSLGGSGAIPGFVRAPWDLFRFASPEVNQSLVHDGVLPWWIDPEVRFAFFRPLASLSHWVDFTLFGPNPVVMHLHTMAWHVLSLLAVRAVYRTIFGAGWLATLALCLYAVDDARGSPVAWVANRNELISCAISVWALALHHRGRHGDRRARWLSPLALAVAMFASEGAIAVTAYLFAYELFLDDGPLRPRLMRLVPYAGAVLSWAVVYRGLGYGIARSGLYFDPLREPLSYLKTLPERFSMLWLAQLGGPWSEGWNAYPVMFPGLQYVVVALAFVIIAGTLYIFAPLLRKDPVARFWLLGAGIGTLPACGAFPADRLLPWIAVGGMGITAQFFQRFVERPDEPGVRTRLTRLGAAGVVVAHLVMAPLLLPLRSVGIAQVRAAIERADRTIPSSPDITSRVVVYVNPAAEPFASYIPITRAALGVPRPLTQRWLSTSASAVHVTREDDRTLRVSADGGYMILPSERMFRHTGSHPFHPGDVIEASPLTVTVVRVTPDGRLEEILARFDRPLEDPTFLWLAWSEDGYAPFTPPAIGQAKTLPAADLVKVAYGKDSPIARALRGPSASPGTPDPRR